MEEYCDLLCISPHSDDAEIGLGGTLRLLGETGRRVWVADLTRGELGSNATPDERWAEAGRAASVLGLAGRVQLELPDGFVSPGDPAQVAAVVHLVRSLRPSWIFVAPDARRHPDHVATPDLVAKAVFLSRLARYRPPARSLRAWAGGADPPEAEPTWICPSVAVTATLGREPALLFDCSTTWQAKLEALRCFDSQFRRAPDRRPTMINDPSFLDKIERRGRHWGERAGVRHAEALVTLTAPVLTDLPEEPWR